MRFADRVGFLHQRQNAATSLEVGFADFGQAHAPGGAFEQTQAELGLQRRNMTGDLGLRQPELLGSRRKPAAFDHAGKDLHGLESIHGGAYLC